MVLKHTALWLTIEPLSHMLKQTMTATQIHHIDVKQHTTQALVVMHADDTTIFSGGIHHITHSEDDICTVTGDGGELPH